MARITIDESGQFAKEETGLLADAVDGVMLPIRAFSGDAKATYVSPMTATMGIAAYSALTFVVTDHLSTRKGRENGDSVIEKIQG